MMMKWRLWSTDLCQTSLVKRRQFRLPLLRLLHRRRSSRVSHRCRVGRIVVGLCLTQVGVMPIAEAFIVEISGIESLG